MKKLAFVTLSVLLFLLIITAAWLRIRYGGGKLYPDISTEPLMPAKALENVFTYSEPLGNIAVSKDNRIFFTVHPESRPTGHKVLEVIDGKAVPFPDTLYQKTHFNTVLGLAIDSKDRLWTLDHGNHGFEQARLLAFDLKTNTLVHDHVFAPEIAEKGSFFNDLQLSIDGRFVFIADVSFFRKNPAIVVYDSYNGAAWRKLEGHPSVQPQDWIIQTPQKKMTFLGGLIALKPGVDGIVVGRMYKWLYYGAMTHDQLYRIPVVALFDPVSDAGQFVKRVGRKPLSDGLSVDTAGNIYITDVEHSGLMVMDRFGKAQTLIRDEERIRWADGLSFGGDGYLYLTDSAIPDQMLRSKAHMRSAAPYNIYRIRPDHGGFPGR